MQNSEQSNPAGYAHLVSYRGPADQEAADEGSGMFWMACALVGAFLVIAVTFVAATGLGAAA